MTRYLRKLEQISLKWKVIIPVIGIVLAAFAAFAWLSLRAMPDASQARPGELLLAALGTVVLLVAALLIVLYVVVSRPVEELSAAMRRVEEGDLDTRAHIRSGDELERLAEAFNHMLEELQAKNRQLVEAGQQLLQSEKLASIGLLASGVAHEINNPVATISVSAESLLETEPQPERRRFLQAILEESERIGGIVRQLLHFDRGGHVHFADCDLAAVVDQALEEARWEAERSGVEVRRHGSLSGVVVLGQCDQLRRAFGNIIDNAIRAMPEGGRLDVGAEARDSHVSLWFRDTGGGIPPENLDRIFDPFFSTREVGEGFGLGLSVTYEIVRRHGGEISVESGRGGTTFTVKLRVRGETDHAGERTGTADSAGG